MRFANPYHNLIDDNQGLTRSNLKATVIKLLYLMGLMALGAYVSYMGYSFYDDLIFTLIISSGFSVVNALVTYLLPSLVPLTASLCALCHGYTLTCLWRFCPSLFLGLSLIGLFLSLALVLLCSRTYQRLHKNLTKVLSKLYWPCMITYALIIVGIFIGPPRATLINDKTLYFLLLLVIIGLSGLHISFDLINKNSLSRKTCTPTNEWLFAFGILTIVSTLTMRILELLSLVKQKKAIK